ncbi:MOSC domain-containing protein [Altererythrobacter arenosus]|uniref:MOSC domain-containing protein n=1 Tax=Altererythrobacter arenosus TaxID=3032592 RepID=A0ABY8FNX5_9SPHN|nr:MOSC domain-containing protein [Altererythrobacter sp. CAU 1644]WFL76724.1 MOSC domain-containing protein [Altererythrobacter sp. CAU 1644]
MKIAVDAICAGSAATLPSGSTSAISKQPLKGVVTIGERGIEIDTQVDRKHHGYPAMALHHYPHDNYAWLRHHFGALPRLDGPGSMGENISTIGLTEHDVLIGDRFRLGSALIEVTQPRQPCSTIEQHLEAKGIVKAIVASGRSGWFYRVLEPGTAQAGDALELVERGHAGWSVARAGLAVYGPNRAPDSELRELASLERVSDRHIGDINKRLGV